MARLSLDPNCKLDFTIPYWKGLDETAANAYFSSMPGWTTGDLNGLQIGTHEASMKMEIIAHPLWEDNETNIGPELAPTYALGLSQGYDVKITSIFELLRRVSG